MAATERDELVTRDDLAERLEQVWAAIERRAEQAEAERQRLHEARQVIEQLQLEVYELRREVQRLKANRHY